MQALAGFVFNGIGVVLQVINMVFHATILVLQLLNLLLQLFIFYPFLLVGRDAVLPEDDVITEKDRQHDGCCRSNASAHTIGEARGAHHIRIRYNFLHNLCTSGATPPFTS